MRSYADVARRLLPLAIVGGLLAVAAVAASVATPGVHSVPIPTESPDNRAGGFPTSASPSLGGTPGTPHTGGLVPAWAAWIEAAIVVAITLAIIAILVWHFISNYWLNIRQVPKDRANKVEAMSARRDELIAAVDEGIERLASDGDPRSAIIACWVRLEEVAEAAGTPRDPSDAPADLVTRLLSAHRVSRRALTSLADLYRAARYSTIPIDEGMRQRALAALGQVRAELAASTAGPDDDGYPPVPAGVPLRPGAPDGALPGAPGSLDSTHTGSTDHERWRRR